MAVSKKQARESAEAIHTQFPQLSKVPVPVERIARKLQVSVRYQPMDKEISGMIFIKDGKPILGVNNLHHPNRQRFTIAHELGHFMLHKDKISKEVHLDTNFGGLMRDQRAAEGVYEIEIQANTFAAELLMPRHKLEEELAAIDADLLSNPYLDDEAEEFVASLAKKFKVSTLAMQTRIANLQGVLLKNKR